MKNSRLLLGIASLVVLMLNAGIAEAGTAGYVQFVNGQASLTTAGRITRPLQKGEAINEGDTIVTSSRTYVQVKMQDGGFISVRPETQLKFDSFVFTGKAGAPERSFFSLLSGGFRAVTGLIGTVRKSDYRITTPTATIGVRGTDHEALYLPVALPGALAGAYSKVNVGETSLTTNKGTINVLPNQMGFAGGINQIPQLKPVNTILFTVAAAPTKTIKESKEEKEKEKQQEQQLAQQGGGKQEKGDAQQQQPADAQKGEGMGDEPVRAIAIVDEIEPVAGVSVAVAAAPAAPASETETGDIKAVEPETVLPVKASTGGLKLDATAQTVTAGGTTVSVQDGIYSIQAKTAADAASAAATVAQNAATAAGTNNTTLTGIAQVSTAPATAAIGSANTAVSSASPLVSSALALTPANAGTTASDAQTSAGSAATKAAAAGSALTANGAFADSTAGPANTATQTANTALQSANTTLQSAAGTMTTQNTALTNAKNAATTALNSANTNLATANTALGTAGTQNTVIASAQAAAATSLSAAQAAATAAQTAAGLAQTAATQAATLQAAGDLTGAQAQLLIAQQQLATAQTEQAKAIAEQTAIATQLANAQAAKTAANNAVTSATSAASAAATSAATAQTQATNASNASTAANNALATITTQSGTVTSNAAIVNANAPIAAYNNPAVASSNFIGHFAMPVPGTPSGFDMAQEFINTQLANTTYVLDGNGNLVEMRSTPFNILPVQGAPTTSIANADVKWSGGTAADTFKLADNSIYGGRWMNSTVTVTDLITSTVTTYTPAGSLWAVLLTPNVGYVQSLIGTTTYTQAGATAPFDTAGNVGTLISATLVADFTSQLVNAALNLTMPVASSMAGTYDITANGMQINTVASGAGYGGFGGPATPVVNCTGTCAAGVGNYSANVGGIFAGTAAASAGLGYELWPTVAAGSPVTDLVQGLVAFNVGTAPSSPQNPTSGIWSARGHMLLGSTATGWERGRFNDGGQFALPETSFIMDGGGNLVRSLHVNYNERFVQNATSTAANQYNDAMVTYSGGIASERYITPDNNLIIGRWNGGQMTVVDNQGILPNLVNNLGSTSSYWFMTTAVPTNYVPQLVGTTTYTQGGATLPTDSFGHVGTLPVASLSADFTAQTVNASVAFTIASQGLTIANPAIPIVAGTEVFEGVIELGTAPTVTCTGTGCVGGYDGWLTGGFAGAQATSANLAYKVWPTAPADSLVNDLIQGVVAFYTVTPPMPGPDRAYTPNHIAVETAGGMSFNSGINSGMLASPADLVYVAGGTSTSGALQSMTFRDIGGGSNWMQTSTITGGTATSANAASNASTGIEYGAWTGNTGQSNSWTTLLGGKNGSAPSAWMYGPSAYVDAAYLSGPSLIGAMAGTFTYQLDGATAPTSNQSGLTGVMNSATVTADFVNMLVSASLYLTMPGNENWGASITSQPISLGMGSLNAQPVVTYSVGAGTPLVACPTCSGNMSATFTGQNLAGIIASYDLNNNMNTGSSDVSGSVALTRNFAGNANPVVTDGAPAPTGNIEVALAGHGYSYVQSYPLASSTTTGNLLTTFGSSGGGSSDMTTVTCTICTTTPTGQVATSGIHYGTWDAGTYDQSFSNTFAAGTMPPGYWITGPEAGPLYLPQALVGTASYAFDSGQVSNGLGVAGTVAGTTTLALDFSKQAVGINLDFSLADTATTPVVRSWNVSTAPGNEAALGSQGNGSAAFRASNNGGGGGEGLLTVSVDSGATPVTVYNANVYGQLTGSGLNGAIMSFDLHGVLNPATTTSTFENISGVAAFTGAVQNTATSYRYVAFSFYEPFALVPQPIFGFYANNAARVTQDVAGNLTQFDTQFIAGGGGGGSMTLASNTSTLIDQGSDAVTGISWGRWAGGTFNGTDRITGVITPLTQAGSLHWIAESAATSATTLPVVGSYTYVNAGGTTPTDNLGNLGTLNLATLTADFTASTVNMGVNVTMNGATLDAVGTNVPIIQRTVFYASSQEPAASTSHLNVTCAGTTGTCGATLGGTVIGKFSGAGAIGAAMTYGLQNGNSVVSGVTAFHR